MLCFLNLSKWTHFLRLGNFCICYTIKNCCFESSPDKILSAVYFVFRKRWNFFVMVTLSFWVLGSHYQRARKNLQLSMVIHSMRVQTGGPRSVSSCDIFLCDNLSCDILERYIHGTANICSLKQWNFK